MSKHPTLQSKGQLKKAKTVLRELAVLSEQRGSDSSGLAVLSNTECKIHKSLLKSSKFVTSREWATSMDDMVNSNVYLGHTRFATMGDVTKENAHPFKVGRTVGAHNGCLTNMSSLQVTLSKSCEVDSQLVFKAIDDSQTIQEAINYIKGDFALSFVKDTYDTLYLCRETNRPLSVAYWSEARILFYASKKEYIEKALLKAKLYKVDTIDLEINKLYGFNINKFSSDKTNVSITDFDFVSQEYSWASNIYNSYNYPKDNNGFVYYSQQGSLWQTKSIDDELYGESNPIDESNLLDKRYAQDDEDLNWFYDTVKKGWFYIDVKNKVLSQEEFKALEVETSDLSCDYCGLSIDDGDCDCYGNEYRGVHL